MTETPFVMVNFMGRLGPGRSRYLVEHSGCFSEGVFGVRSAFKSIESVKPNPLPKVRGPHLIN